MEYGEEAIANYAKDQARATARVGPTMTLVPEQTVVIVGPTLAVALDTLPALLFFQ